ncbi:hypothetical protein JYG30_08495 [Fibrella sp. USSR17]
MRNSLLLVFGLFYALTVQAQDSIPLYSDAIARQRASLCPSIGLDLYQAVWFAYSGNQHDTPATYVHPISVTLYVPSKDLNKPNRSLFINAGYVAYGGTLQRNIYQTGHSAHVRVGVEHTNQYLILGYSGLLSGWSGAGSFLFNGPTFGDYQESIGRRAGLAIGAEGHIGALIPLSKRLSLRPVLRGTILAKAGMVNNLRPPHLSGVDWQTERQAGVAASFQVNFVVTL